MNNDLAAIMIMGAIGGSLTWFVFSTALAYSLEERYDQAGRTFFVQCLILGVTIVLKLLQLL